MTIKEGIAIAKEHAAKEFDPAFSWIALENGTSVGNIKFSHYKRAVDRAMEIYTEMDENGQINGRPAPTITNIVTNVGDITM